MQKKQALNINRIAMKNSKKYKKYFLFPLLVITSLVCYAENCDIEDLKHYRSIVRTVRLISDIHTQMIELNAKVFIECSSLSENQKKIVEPDFDELTNMIRNFTQIGLLDIKRISMMGDFKSEQKVVEVIDQRNKEKMDAILHKVETIRNKIKRSL